MAVCAEDMLRLVQARAYGKLESAWMEAVADPGTDPVSLVPVLAALAKADQAETAELLAWSAFNEVRDRLGPTASLTLIRELALAVPASDELRNTLVSQYRDVFDDHLQIESLLRTSGLLDGSKSPRLALRTMDLCLHTHPGSFLLSRRDDTVALVEEVAEDGTVYTVSFNNLRRQYEAAELSTEFGPVDEEDFRVLAQHRPERIAELLEQDPSALIVSIVRSQSGRFNVDDLRFVLCPRYLPQDRWAKWWTKARAHLKQTHLVRLEGRNPATLVYDPSGWTIEELSWQKFPRSEAAREYHDAIEEYFREARSRNLEPKPEYLSRMAAALADRLAGVGRHAADSGLAMTLVFEALLQRGARPDSRPPTSAPDVIRRAADPAALLGSLTDERLWPAALAAARDALPQRWTETLAGLLPGASFTAVESIAAELRRSGHTDLLSSCIDQMMNDPTRCIQALAWVWKGSDALSGVAVPSRVELLVRILGSLAELDRAGDDQRERTKAARVAVKSALASEKCAAFRACLDSIDLNMASTIRSQVSRLDGLGPSLRDQLTEEIRKRFPALWEKRRIDPWKNESVIFTTSKGLHKLQADIDHLVNVEIPANAKAIGAAAAHGDLSENSEYKFALEARDMLRARLATMQRHLALVRTIEPEEIPTSHVGVGSKVTLRRSDDGPTRVMTFLGPWDAAIEAGIYNYQAPMSQRLMGKRPGDSIPLPLDGDAEAEWTLERIERGL